MEGIHAGIWGALRRTALFRGMEEEELFALLDCMGGGVRRYPRGLRCFEREIQLPIWA